MHPPSFLYFLLLLLRNVFQIEGCGERGRKRRGLHDTSVDFGLSSLSLFCDCMSFTFMGNGGGRRREIRDFFVVFLTVGS